MDSRIARDRPRTARIGMQIGSLAQKHLTAADEAYNPDGPHECVMFDYQMIKRRSVEVEIADVNREARQVTLHWTKGFLKSFDPETDVLFVDTSLWGGFFKESELLHGGPDIREPRILLLPYITRLFVTDELFEQAIDEFITVLTYFHTLTAFQILLTRSRYIPKGMYRVLPLPDLIPIEGRRLTWHLEHKEFRLHGSEEPGSEEDMFAILSSVADKLTAKFIEGRKQKFEMATALFYRHVPGPLVAGSQRPSWWKPGMRLTIYDMVMNNC
ncbi:unnamed protein product [Clonostachys chloroleuca]|uniref:Uncharacterized protein n=1 Tax=Clonostachys chloroleuca TaxID=1926264 RepID=A0AA35LXY1_9HYPO|nr:unnamed protein product [Clonostachys chloroleuca]